jgi:cobalt-zinc-cadmium efflux system outer membrane protein
VVSRPDVTLAHLALDQIRLSLSEAQRKRAEARVRIADAVGLPVSALDSIQFSFAFLEKLPAELPSRRQALANRADILSALAEYDATQSALQLEIAKQYPDIHFGPGYEYDQGENKWSVGFSILLPVLNQNQGPIAEAEAQRKEAEVQFRALQARMIGEIDGALAGYRASLRKLEAADALLLDRKKQQESLKTMFHVGEADRLALLDAELELASSMLSRLDAFILVQQSLGLLEDAVQHPLDRWD